jgi:hypothetical protein
MVRVVLGGKRSIEAAWRNAPTANGHRFAFESARSSGYVAQMDPERRDSGFSRSIVLKTGLVSADVLRNARGSVASAAAEAASPIDPVALVPSLLGTGVQLSAPVIQGSTVIEGSLRYKIPFKIADRDNLPAAVQASARWDLLEPVAADPAAAAPEPPAGEAATEPAGPDFGLISAEQPGDVIAPVALNITRSAMALNLATPTAPGRYLLTITLHDADGVVYDGATQALVPSLVVRVTGDTDAGIDAPARLDLAPGATTDVAVWVANLGRTPWGHLAINDPRDPDGSVAAEAARITGTWVALGAIDDPDQLAAADAASVGGAMLPAGFKPRALASPTLRLFAPSVAGDYLLVLDIVTPEAGSLTAKGVEPAVIRVTVGEQIAPVVTPAPSASAPASAPPSAPASASAPAPAPSSPSN